MTESGLRRKADREGYRLVKYRGEWPVCNYDLLDIETGGAVNAGFHDLDEIEDWLAE